MRQRYILFLVDKKFISSPGWCGSVDCAPAYEPKGCWFNSHSGHMPRLWALYPVGGVRVNHTLIFLSVSFSLLPPLALKINK